MLTTTSDKVLGEVVLQHPGLPEITGPDFATPNKFRSWGYILLHLGDVPVWDPGNKSGCERGSFLSVQAFFTIWG